MQTADVDFDARYTVASMPGVAWALLGWAQREIPEDWQLICENDHEHDEPACWAYCEPMLVDRDDMVRAVMVGDDREHLVDISELELLPDDGYCAGCGQTGCTADGRLS